LVVNAKITFHKHARKAHSCGQNEVQALTNNQSGENEFDTNSSDCKAWRSDNQVMQKELKKFGNLHSLVNFLGEFISSNQNVYWQLSNVT